jgi:hypothetical protein
MGVRDPSARQRDMVRGRLTTVGLALLACRLHVCTNMRRARARSAHVLHRPSPDRRRGQDDSVVEGGNYSRARISVLTLLVLPDESRAILVRG